MLSASKEDRHMSALEVRHGFVELGGLKIHYDEAGAGRALVLVHGGGPGSSGLNTFSRNMAALADRHRVIAIDLPGYGQSTKLKISEPLFGYYAKVLAGFIDALKLEKAHLAGNSMGGAVSLKTALDFPQKADRLVLMSPVGGYSPFQTPPTDGVRLMVTFYLPPGPSLERMRQFVNYLVYEPASVSDEIIKERLARAADADTAEFMPLRAGPNMPPIEELWRERLDRVSNETLIIWGREDRMNPMDQGMMLMRQIPKARLLVMPQCGHWSQWEKADEFNRAVAAFLEG
jgi:4,5:9,10-diseco-3-hydroxy-5,9,17-trioxoandrosta-1(10),2-diene-4-oate hydrolase